MKEKKKNRIEKTLYIRYSSRGESTEPASLCTHGQVSARVERWPGHSLTIKRIETSKESIVVVYIYRSCYTENLEPYAAEHRFQFRFQSIYIYTLTVRLKGFNRICAPTQQRPSQKINGIKLGDVIEMDR